MSSWLSTTARCMSLGSGLRSRTILGWWEERGIFPIFIISCWRGIRTIRRATIFSSWMPSSSGITHLDWVTRARQTVLVWPPWLMGGMSSLCMPPRTSDTARSSPSTTAQWPKTGSNIKRQSASVVNPIAECSTSTSPTRPSSRWSRMNTTASSPVVPAFCALDLISFPKPIELRSIGSTFAHSCSMGAQDGWESGSVWHLAMLSSSMKSSMRRHTSASGSTSLTRKTSNTHPQPKIN